MVDKIIKSWPGVLTKFMTPNAQWLKSGRQNASQLRAGNSCRPLWFAAMLTVVGHLIFELGGLPEHALNKLKAEAEHLGQGSFAFILYIDVQKEERENVT